MSFGHERLDVYRAAIEYVGWAYRDAVATEHGARPALITASDTISYAQLRQEVDLLAKGLAAHGVSKGTRLGLLMPNTPEWLACAFAAWGLGAVVVPLNTLLQPPELSYALRTADVTVLLMVDRFLKHDYIAALRAIGADLDGSTSPLRCAALPALSRIIVSGETRPAGCIDFKSLTKPHDNLTDRWLQATRAQVTACEPATIFFTSGTTADPKGVVHTHSSMLSAANNVADRLGLTADDRTWAYLPFFFTGGLVAVALATLARGGAVILQEVFEPGATLKLLAENACTTFFAWPHQAEALIKHPDFASTTLRIRKGPGAQAAWADKIFGAHHHAVGTWGMTETGPMAASTRWDDPVEERASAHGRPMRGLEFRIVDPDSGIPLGTDAEGELCVRGTTLMAQYYKTARSDCFDADGFFHTGDLARIDARGLLHFLGRLKDVIKTAGVNVAAAEVEGVLLQHPGVRVAYVVGAPHPARGENVAAFVVAGAESCTEEELLTFCRERLASYKVPRQLIFCREEELPVLGSGKVDKRALRDRLASLAAVSG